MADLILPDARFEMPELFIPRQKPVGAVAIDWSNPITRGLLDFWSFTDSLTSLMGRSPVAGNALIQGPSVAFDGSTKYLEYEHLTELDNSSNFTFFIDVFKRTDNADFYFMSHNAGNANTGIALFNDFGGPNSTTANVHDLFVRPTTASNWERSAPADGNVGGYTNLPFSRYRIVATFDGSLPTIQRAKTYTNGVDESVGDNNGSGATHCGTHTENLSFGRKAYNGSSHLEGLIYSAAIWPRTLSKEEAISLTLDPYQLLIPA